MTFYPWEEDDLLLLGIDPAQKKSAIAWLGKNQEGEIIQGVFSIEDILESSLMESTIQTIKSEAKFERIKIAVEYPTWNAGGSQTVRAAANTFIRMMKKIFKSADIIKVDPNTWQAIWKYRSRPKGLSTKDWSSIIVKTFPTWKPDNSDEMDAILILNWLRLQPQIITMKKSTKKGGKK